jgi:hypothetical protein
MKYRVTLSLVWVVATFLLLSWALYAANDYESRMLGAVTGQPGTPPTLERAKKLKAKLRETKNADEAHELMSQFSDDVDKYLRVGSASVARDQMIQRVWILWGFSASVPLLFLWWPTASGCWRRSQTAAASGGVSSNVVENESSLS